MSGIINSVGSKSGIIGSDVYPAGHVIQTDSVNATGYTSSNLTTWVVQTDITLTFTPLFASSNILLSTCFNANKATSGYAFFDFYKNASDVTENYNLSGAPYPADGSHGVALMSSDDWCSISYEWLDPVAENSTSEKTYKISFKSSNTDSATLGWGDASFMILTAMEIAT